MSVQLDHDFSGKNWFRCPNGLCPDLKNLCLFVMSVGLVVSMKYILKPDALKNLNLGRYNLVFQGVYQFDYYYSITIVVARVKYLLKYIIKFLFSKALRTFRCIIRTK